MEGTGGLSEAAQRETEVGVAAGGVVTLAGHFDVFPDRPIVDLRIPHAAAYVAVDRQFPASSLFALVCEPEYPQRLEVLETLHGMRLEAMLTPLEWGMVDWPLARRRCFVIVYDRPVGGAMIPSLDHPIPAMHEDALIHEVLPPLIASLRDFFPGGTTHRAIRATNFYFRDAARRVLTLGDCCATPPAMSQPLVYETIESALANPWGRGDGQPSDDLYSLGVTLVFLLMGRNPVAHLTDEQIINEKVNRGSYAALVGNERLPTTMTEPVRGLITDDTKERWTIQDLEFWLEGRRLSPKQPSLPKRATRGIEFAGETYYTARALAYAFSRNTAAAAKTIKGQDFEIWLQRSLNDIDRTKMVAAAMSEGQGAGAASHDERLTARVCIALDPAAPVRYKGFACAIDAFGGAFSGAFRGHGSVATICESISGRLPVFWFSAQPGLRPEHVPILKSFERLRFHLEDRRPGFGPERVLYEMNPSVHCLSPLIEAEYVLDPAGALQALENTFERRPSEELTIDRHFAAFVAARCRLAELEWFDSLASPRPEVRVLGALKMLVGLQDIRGPSCARNVAQRIARQLPVVIETFHNRERRRELLDGLPKLADRGNLADLLGHVDSAAERQRDLIGFDAAVREYAQIDRALEQLQTELPMRPKHAALLGAQIASGTAAILAWVAALSLLVAMG